MKSRDERQAEFQRRERIRKEKYRLSEIARKEKNAERASELRSRREALSGDLAEKLEAHAIQRDLKDAERVSGPSMLAEVGALNPTAAPFVVVDAVKRMRAKKRLKKRGLL